MNMKYPIYILATLLLAGCQTQEQEEASMTQPIVTKAYLKEGTKVTPLPARPTVRGIDNDLSQGYRVHTGVSSAVYSDATASFATNQLLFNFEPFTLQNGSYTYTGASRFWINDGKTYHHFGAVSTNLEAYTEGSYQIGYNYAKTYRNQIYFTQADEPAHQQDALVADPVVNIQTQYNAPTVNLYFRHALSRILIKIFNSGGATIYDVEGQIMYTTNIYRNGYQSVWGSGIALANTDGATTNLTHTKNKYYALNANVFTLPATAKDGASSMTLGNIFLLPISNSVTTDGWMVARVRYKTDMAGSYTDWQEVSLPACNRLVSGIQYTYSVNLIVETNDLAVTGAEITPWVDESLEIDQLN